MKQYEAVIEVMKDNGGYATLGYLNRHVLNIDGPEWKTKTPFASIRRIVQDERFFFKIRPGLWALKTQKDKIPNEIMQSGEQPRNKEKEDDYTHVYYQGLLVETGNLRKFRTFVANQDKNKVFLGKKLAELVTDEHIYKFGYDNIIRTAQSIDVIWFNERRMPANFFEIEHSTDIYNSLRKFVELQDFHVNFCIVADEARRREYKTKVMSAAVSSISGRVRFWSYDEVAELHAKTSELYYIESKLAI